MDLQINYGNSRSLLRKLEREKARAQEALDSQLFPDLADALYNFSVSAFHIKDWLINQNGIDKDKVHNFLNEVPILQACRDICNSKKHFKITRYEPGEVQIGSTITEISAIIPGEDGSIDVYGKADIWVDVGNKEAYPVVDFMQKVIEEWNPYHDENKI